MAEKLACDMLARDGVAAIWDLHLAALTANDAWKLELAGLPGIPPVRWRHASCEANSSMSGCMTDMMLYPAAAFWRTASASSLSVISGIATSVQIPPD